MGECNYYCANRTNCKCTALVIAVLFGVALGILGFFCLVPAALAGIVAFGIALIALVVLLFAALSDNGNQRGCLCKHLFQLLSGIIGTIVLGIIIIFIDIISISSFITAFLIGLLAFFFALMTGTFVCYISCLANCRYQECD